MAHIIDNGIICTTHSKTSFMTQNAKQPTAEAPITEETTISIYQPLARSTRTVSQSIRNAKILLSY